MTTSTLNAPGQNSTPEEWKSWYLSRLELHEDASAHDPLANSVRRLAHDIFCAQEAGILSDAELAASAKILCDEALFARTDEFAAAHHGYSIDAAFINNLLTPLEGMTFDEVRKELERTRAGIVFTAHPTFAMSTPLRGAVAALASATSKESREQSKAEIASLPHRPDADISLHDEHEASQAAIAQAQRSVRKVTQLVLAWAQQHFPDRWRELVPTPISIATWVGYDLDGRTDIHWGETFRIRLEEKARGLNDYAEALKALDLNKHNGQRDLIADRLSAAAAFASEQAELFTGDLDDPSIVTKAANRLTGNDPRKLVSLEPVIADVNDLIDGVTDDDARMALCVIKAEMKNLGLGGARIHLRINAAQVRSALRADLGIDQGRNFIDRTALTAAAERAQAVTRRKINVASIFLEKMTARRQLMLCAEFIKHIDADTPIRFLIAECEAPATVMGTIYLARLYGVEHRLDISPLFETPEAMESGGRFVERLLAEEEFVEYIRKRGRIAIQIGFSDSGRFMGQIAANLAIERLQILLARALAAKDIRDVEVLIFNTHGESMGRGAYPGTLEQRFDYLMTPWTRSRYAHENLMVNAEASFQGGDGFLHFETEHLASATVAALFQWSMKTPDADRSDQYYADINYSWDFYRAVKTWQESLFEKPDYHVAIGAFAPSMLFVTGSRKTRRQSGAAITGPRSLRAIPHNAILQQLGAPANVSGGVGFASGAEPDRIVDHIRGSERMQEITGVIRNARRLTSLPVLRAYAAIFDASFWIIKSSREGDAAIAQACEELAVRLGDQKISTSIARLSNDFAADLARLDRILHELDGEEGRQERHASRRSLHALHSIRQASIMKAFILVAGLPSFSQRHDCTRATVIDLAVELKFDDLADLLETIFPAANAVSAPFEGIEEESDDQIDAIRGYPEIQNGVIRPLREIHQLMQEIGVGIAHHYGAYG